MFSVVDLEAFCLMKVPPPTSNPDSDVSGGSASHAYTLSMPYFSGFQMRVILGLEKIHTYP